MKPTQLSLDSGEFDSHNARPEIVDGKLIKEIESTTDEDPNFWSQPLNYDRRGAGHRFFQYPAMMLPEVQRRLIQTVKSASPNCRSIIDPFVGSGTALTAGMLNGLDCYGQDINPMSILLSKVKASSFNHAFYTEQTKVLLDDIKQDRLDQLEISYSNIDKWFKNEVALELSKLVRSIRKQDEVEVRRLLWVTLAETVRLTSNDRTSTFKLHSRPLEEIIDRNPSPIKTFQGLLQKNLEDIALHALNLAKGGYLSDSKYVGKVRISVEDSSKIIHTPESTKANPLLGFDLLVSSPPYGDNRTTVPYGQHAFLPLQWIDFEDIDPNVCRTMLNTTNEIDNRSIGSNRNKIASIDEEKVLNLSSTLRKNVHELKKIKPHEVKKVVTFVRDLEIVLEKCSKTMNSYGYMIWTIGNRKVGGIEIQNNLILSELLLHHNVSPVYQLERRIGNKRMAARNKSTTTMTKEDILIFRKNSNG